MPGPYPTGPGSTLGRLRAKIAAKRLFNARRRAAVKARSGGKIAQVVKTVLARNMETKYVAEDIFGPVLLPAGTTTPANLFRLVPRLGSGNGDFQRVGDRVKPIRLTTYIPVHYNAANTNFQDVTVHVVILTVKGAQTGLAVNQVPPTSLLRVGNGNNTDPDAAAYTQTQLMEHVNNYPINDSLYTVKKWYKRRFAKGSYDINGVPGANATSQIAVSAPLHTFKYSWKAPALKYNTAADTLPSNHYPVLAIWCTTNDGSPYAGLLSYGVRSEMKFKDA